MNNISKNVKFGGTALVVLLATSFATAYGQGNGNNQPSGQGGTQTPANVVVTNTPAQPVPAKEQNNPDLQQQFEFTGPFNILAGNGYAQIQLPPVPAGKRLIIQQVSAYAFVQGGSGVITSMRLDIFNGAKYMPAWIPMTYIGAGDFVPSSVYTTVQQVRMVADPTAQPSYLWVTKSKDINYGYSGSVVGDFAIHGYLINMP